MKFGLPDMSQLRLESIQRWLFSDIAMEGFSLPNYSNGELSASLGTIF